MRRRIQYTIHVDWHEESMESLGISITKQCGLSCSESVIIRLVSKIIPVVVGGWLPGDARYLNIINVHKLFLQVWADSRKNMVRIWRGIERDMAEPNSGIKSFHQSYCAV